MKQKQIIIFVFFAILITSCATPQSRTAMPPEYWGIVPLSFKEVVADPAEYSTEKGKTLMIKHEKSLEDIFMNVRKKYNPSEIEFSPYIPKTSSGLSFMKLVASKRDERFLAINVVATFTFFDKEKSTYQERAAILYTKYMRGLLEIAMQETQMINDPDVAGMWILIAWSTIDAKEVKRGEGLALIGTKEDCKNFISNKLTSEDFISRTTIRGVQEGKDLGVISLAVGPTMKAVDTRNKKGFALALFETGTELIAEKKMQTAISFLDRAIELYPDYSEAYYFRGSAYASINKHDVAVENLKKALSTPIEGFFKDYIMAGLSALNNNSEDSCTSLQRAINSKGQSISGFTNDNIPYVVQHDAIFDSVRNAACYKAIIIEKKGSVQQKNRGDR